MKPPLSLLPLMLFFGASPGLAADALPGPGEPVEVLPDLKVKGQVQCSFGFGVTMHREAGTLKVLRLFVGKMEKRSPAAKLGLNPGDEILSINGEKVRGMDGEAKQGARLFSLLCNRAPGETIDLEVAAPDRVHRLTLKALKPAGRPKAGGG